MKKDVLVCLEDILEAMEKADSFIEGFTYEQFETDLRTNFAVVRVLEIIGEATKWLPTALRDRYPDILCTEYATLSSTVTTM